LALFSPDGELLGVETADAWAGVWGRNGKKRFEVPASSDYLSLAFTPDGRRILTALENGTAHLWDVRSGKSVVVFRAPEKPLYSASMSRSGRQIVTVGRAKVRVWDVTRPRALPAPFRIGATLAYAALSPDARSLLTVSANDVRLWNVRTHDSIRLTAPRSATSRDFDYDLADFAVDGTFALAGRPGVPIYDSAGRRLLVLQGHPTTTEVVRFSADGKLVATGDLRGAVRVWDVYTGKQVAALNAHLGPVTSLAFSHDGVLLVTAASDGTAIVWRVP
jgi:WD40 repeat protein